MIRMVIQGFGLALFALSIGLLRSKTYKREFAFLGLAGLTLAIL